MQNCADGDIVTHCHRTPKGRYVVEYESGSYDVFDLIGFEENIENIPEKRVLDFWVTVDHRGAALYVVNKEPTEAQITWLAKAFKDGEFVHIHHEYTVGEGL